MEKRHDWCNITLGQSVAKVNRSIHVAYLCCCLTHAHTHARTHTHLSKYVKKVPYVYLKKTDLYIDLYIFIYIHMETYLYTRSIYAVSEHTHTHTLEQICQKRPIYIHIYKKNIYIYEKKSIHEAYLCCFPTHMYTYAPTTSRANLSIWT